MLERKTDIKLLFNHSKIVERNLTNTHASVSITFVAFNYNLLGNYEHEGILLCYVIVLLEDIGDINKAASC